MLFAFHSYGQNHIELDNFNIERLQINKRGMQVLGTLAIGNIILSPILANRSTGSQKYFHQMNGYWNGVNLLIAGFGYYSAVATNPEGLSLVHAFTEQSNIEKLLLLNTGLDVGYVLGGLYLLERSKNSVKRSDQHNGFGKSIMLQGGFLFIFDFTFYLVHQTHSKELLALLSKVSLSANGASLTWTF